MATKLSVTFVTPTKQVVATEVEQVSAPTVLGEVGILPLHRPLLANLQEGIVTLKNAERRESYAISGGFLEVQDDHVAILAETAEAASDIDVERAKLAFAESATKLKTLTPLDPAYAEALARSRRATVRIQVGESARR